MSENKEIETSMRFANCVIERFSECKTFEEFMSYRNSKAFKNLYSCINSNHKQQVNRMVLDIKDNLGGGYE